MGGVAKDCESRMKVGRNDEDYLDSVRNRLTFAPVSYLYLFLVNNVHFVIGLLTHRPRSDCEADVVLYQATEYLNTSSSCKSGRWVTFLT